jgi:hypothetical protein
MILKDRMKRSSPIWRRIVKRAFGKENKGFLKTQLVSGGAAGDITVSGIKKEDHLVGVVGPSIGDLTSEFSITADAKINNTSGTATNAVASGKERVKAAVIAGGAAGDLTVTGITTNDKLVVVWSIGNGDLTSEFSISAADTINNAAGTSTAGTEVLVVWERAGELLVVWEAFDDE